MDDTAGPISVRRRIITSMVLIVVVAAAASAGFRRLAALRKPSGRSEGGVLPPLVRAETAHRLDYTERLQGFGRAEPLQQATVVAEVAATVLEVSPLLEAGTAVEGPDLPVLVRLDDRDLQDRLERARADARAAQAEIDRLASAKGSLRESLAVAEEEFDAAQRELERMAPLVPKTLTRSDLDMQRIQVSVRQRQKLLIEAQIKENGESTHAAEERLVSLERAVSLAEREAGRAVVRAPFAGRVVSREVDVGERVRVNDPLFAIVNLSRVQVPVALPASSYAEVHPGAKAWVRLPGRDEGLWEGAVTRVAPQINPLERTFFAYLVVSGKASASPVPPGTHVVAEVEGRTHPGVIPVPRRAFLGDRIFVARAEPDGQAWRVTERTPRVERFLAGEALVSEGLEDGERFLVTNLESVAEGSLVRLAPAQGTAAGSDAPGDGSPTK